MSKSMSRFVVRSAAGIMMAAAALAVAPGAAGASSDYSHAVYQFTFSLNCDSHTAACVNFVGLGGEWGWMALSGSPTGGTGNAQVTGCGHNFAGPRGGAGHESYDPAWSVFSSPSAPPLVGAGLDPTNPLLSPTDPNGNYIQIDPSPDWNPQTGQGIHPFFVPATYGHYSISWDGAHGELTIAP
jgi:hypothetical protein